jgi:hypothetical protein
LKKIKLICIQVPSRPGVLGSLTRTLFKKGVNIEAIFAPEANDFGLVRLYPDDFQGAEAALSELGYPLGVEEAYLVRLKDKPGSLMELVERLALSGININYLFCTTTGRGRVEHAILSISGSPQGEKILDELTEQD